MTRESVTLYFREGSSDKVYSAVIDDKDGGCVVNFAYGRRGSTLQTGTKTVSPVPFEKAKSIYDKLVREKTAKGYSPGPDGTLYAQTDNEQRDTGLRCQLLNPVDEAHVEKLLDDTAWWMQQKYDGRRVLVRKQGNEITGINRKGLAIGLPEPIVAHARQIDGTVVIDGECVGDRLYAFDCLERDGVEVAGFAYSKRLDILTGLIQRGAMECAPTAISPRDKRSLFTFLKQERKEGVVFKRPDALYAPGRPASGGTQLKFKFQATASVIIAHVNTGKRSVAICVLDGKRRVAIGNVTVPPNAEIPAAGSVLEVRYLYAYVGGSLYQPLFLGQRDDVDSSACTIRQLKYKASEEDEG